MISHRLCIYLAKLSKILINTLQAANHYSHLGPHGRGKGWGGTGDGEEGTEPCPPPTTHTHQLTLPTAGFCPLLSPVPNSSAEAPQPPGSACALPWPGLLVPPLPDSRPCSLQGPFSSFIWCLGRCLAAFLGRSRQTTKCPISGHSPVTAKANVHSSLNKTHLTHSHSCSISGLSSRLTALEKPQAVRCSKHVFPPNWTPAKCLQPGEGWLRWLCIALQTRGLRPDNIGVSPTQLW